MQRKTLASLTAVLLTSLVGFQAVADTTPEDAADYRTAIMTALRGHIGSASMIVRGLVEDNGHLVDHALALSNTAGELDRIFQEGSNVGESEALPAIWEKPEEFAAAVANMQEAADAFLEAAESGDPEVIGPAFRNVGMGCRGCHDNFRVAHD